MCVYIYMCIHACVKLRVNDHFSHSVAIFSWVYGLSRPFSARPRGRGLAEGLAAAKGDPNLMEEARSKSWGTLGISQEIPRIGWFIDIYIYIYILKMKLTSLTPQILNDPEKML